MGGSTAFGLLAPHAAPATLLILLSIISFFAVGSTWILLLTGAVGTPTGLFAVFLCLTAFEFGIGGYMAAIATLKVPTFNRTTLLPPPSPVSLSLPSVDRDSYPGIRCLYLVSPHPQATYVPDELRATIYNIIRVPLNIIVVVINVLSLSSEFTFRACTVLMAIALLGSCVIPCLIRAAKEEAAKESAALL